MLKLSFCGLTNVLAKRGEVSPGSADFGLAFENYLHHELQTYRDYCARRTELFYWRLSNGAEVDFIVGDLRLAIECKSSTHAKPHHLKGLRELMREHPRLGRRILVSFDPIKKKTEDGIELWPAEDFLKELWSGNLF